ncbi:UNKNOWN [Stylonychia lemnae]|uniref:Uncharacterized protein n=1 Tax=Stylonychia lemnae TaxID=5949 RepID=A0A078AUQ7_STYLE|nr:UNKNOWN [Stylonychia lemnae]|eukprot:CDW85909.1 UNKNOWN [Stylonychia lemnae]
MLQVRAELELDTKENKYIKNLEDFYVQKQQRKNFVRQKNEVLNEIERTDLDFKLRDQLIKTKDPLFEIQKPNKNISLQLNPYKVKKQELQLQDVNYILACSDAMNIFTLRNGTELQNIINGTSKQFEENFKVTYILAEKQYVCVFGFIQREKRVLRVFYVNKLTETFDLSLDYTETDILVKQVKFAIFHNEKELGNVLICVGKKGLLQIIQLANYQWNNQVLVQNEINIQSKVITNLIPPEDGLAIIQLCYNRNSKDYSLKDQDYLRSENIKDVYENGIIVQKLIVFKAMEIDKNIFMLLIRKNSIDLIYLYALDKDQIIMKFKDKNELSILGLEKLAGFDFVKFPYIIMLQSNLVKVFSLRKNNKDNYYEIKIILQEKIIQDRLHQVKDQTLNANINQNLNYNNNRLISFVRKDRQHKPEIWFIRYDNIKEKELQSNEYPKQIMKIIIDKIYI